MKFSFIKIFLHKLIIYSYKSIKNYFKNFTNTKPVLLILAKNIEISIKNKINYFYHRQIINNFNKKTDKSTKSVSPLGLEPRTHSLKGCRSNRLSYGPTVNFPYYTTKSTNGERNFNIGVIYFVNSIA